MRRADEGSATVLVVAVIGAVAAVLIGALALISAATASTRARTAADLAALAGADVILSGAAVGPCETVRRVVRANDAALATCTVAGEVVEVEVTVRPSWPGLGPAHARSRAGPAPGNVLWSTRGGHPGDRDRAPVRRDGRHAAGPAAGGRLCAMTIYCVEYRYTDDSAARDTHRPEHRAYLDGQPGLVVSGPYLDEPAGALIILRADSLGEVEEIMAADPFQREGLVAERTIRSFNPVLGPLSAGFGDG
jgi:uncharacterized protein